jgi:hypothetical protein
MLYNTTSILSYQQSAFSCQPEKEETQVGLVVELLDFVLIADR